MEAITILDKKLREAGIPINGVSGDKDNCRIDFTDEATKQQRALAITIVNEFDWKNIEEIAEPSVLKQVRSMTNEQKNEFKSLLGL
jgi:hypothetical protein